MNTYVRRYLLHGLRATPIVLEKLLEGLTEEEADRRPDPERFTLREVLAHLADWEPIWLDRIRRIATENEPLLPSYDEGQFAIDNHYDQIPVETSLRAFITGRAAFTDYIEALPEDAFERLGQREELGPISLFELIALVLGHDGYHTRQVIEYRTS